MNYKIPVNLFRTQVLHFFFSYNALFFKAQYSDLFPPNNIVPYKNHGVIFYVIQCVRIRDSLQSVQ